MKPIELKDLIVGVLALITAAIAFGKYDALQAFARREAVKSLRGWKSHPFFPAGYQIPGQRLKASRGI